MMSRYLVIFLCGVLLLGAAPRGLAQPVPTTATPIRHVIIIMQENHSFDNYFGTYPTANGTLEDQITSKLPPVDGLQNGTCVQYGGGCISPRLANSSSPQNPTEGQLNYQADYPNDSAAGFAESSGPQSMVYFDYHYIPAYWDYAEEYGLADNYFAPVLSQTLPNRLMMLTGATPISIDAIPPPYTPYNGTVMGQLDGAGVSWGYFDWVATPTNGSWPQIQPLNFISGAPPQAASDVQDIPRLYGYLANGTGLPDVSFVNSQGNATYDEHPPFNVTSGELWVTSVVDRVMESSYWNSTAIFITWDEGGGFYDHVVPPSEFNFSNFEPPLRGFGQRVPLLVVSPFSKESYVSNTLMSHLSLLHFIEYNWRLPALTSNVATANLPLGFFNFSQALRSPLVLSTGSGGNLSASTYPLPLQALRSTARVSSTATRTTTSRSAPSSLSSSLSSSSSSSSALSTSASTATVLTTSASSGHPGVSSFFSWNSAAKTQFAAAGGALFLVIAGLSFWLRGKKKA
jgi:phospholipase C